jgi:uncharacterized protein (TIGR02246 family)
MLSSTAYARVSWSQEGSADDVAAIKAVLARLDTAVMEFDAEAMTARITDEAIWMAPQAARLVGRDEIEAELKGYLKAFGRAFSGVERRTEIEQIRVAGDWAVARGTYYLRLTPEAGAEPIEVRGNYVVVLERQSAGSWLVAEYIWTADKQIAPNQRSRGG